MPYYGYRFFFSTIEQFYNGGLKAIESNKIKRNIQKNY